MLYLRWRFCHTGDTEKSFGREDIAHSSQLLGHRTTPAVAMVSPWLHGPRQGRARSGIVHRCGATLHEALTSRTRRESTSAALPYDRTLASCSPSLLQCHHPRIWQGPRRNAHVRLVETLFRDRQGRRSWGREGRLGPSAAKKSGLTCAPLNCRVILFPRS